MLMDLKLSAHDRNLVSAIASALEERIVDRLSRAVGGHVWRQFGMTGSEHDECVLCKAKGGGLGQEAEPAALVPCVYRVVLRNYDSGRFCLRVDRNG